MRGTFSILFLVTCLHTAVQATPYKPDPGPYEVLVAKKIAIDVSGRDNPLQVHIAYPDGDGPFPLVVLSHGGGCPHGSYSVLSNHWASHGYVVIAPTHKDSVSEGFSFEKINPRAMEGVIRSRIQDLSSVLDHLDAIAGSIPGLVDKLDREHIVAAGHSMGGAAALTATGLVLENPFTKEKLHSSESRYNVLLLLSEVGHNPTLPEEPWQYSVIPNFVYTGTDDYGSESRGNTRIPFQYNILNSMPAAPSPTHYLWVDGVDHYLGGLWCRSDVSGPPDQDGLAILRGVSTVFLDAYTKGNTEAFSFLSTDEMTDLTDGRAALSLK